MNRFKKGLLFVFALLVVGVLLAVFWIGPSVMIGEKRTVFPDAFYRRYSPENTGLQIQEMKAVAYDGETLVGWTARADLDTAPSGTFIILHGVGARKEPMPHSMSWATSHGFDAACFDSRGHGESGGAYVTYGAHESKDVSSIINVLQDEGFAAPYFIWGTSMGGAIGLLATAQDHRIAGAIIESTFCSFEEVANDYFERLVGIRLPWLIEGVLRVSETRADFDRGDVQPEQACAQIEVPILLIHGKADKHISVECAYRNFKALQSARKELLIIEGADHNTVWQTDPYKVKSTIESFVEEHFRP